jgi:hypothetical protein
MFAGNPIENLRRCHRFLRRMGIQGPSDSAPAILDYLLGKSLRLGFRLEFSGCANGPAFPIVKAELSISRRKRPGDGLSHYYLTRFSFE